MEKCTAMCTFAPDGKCSCVYVVQNCKTQKTEYKKTQFNKIGMMWCFFERLDSSNILALKIHIGWIHHEAHVQHPGDDRGGTPSHRPFFFEIFHYKPTSYWGIPNLGNPQRIKTKQFLRV